MPDEKHQLPGTGFLGWLGRQVGHVKKAIETDVAQPIQPPPSKILYRDCTVAEVQSPTDPNLKLRRTIIDEVVDEK
jgi:hypothetical protein